MKRSTGGSSAKQIPPKKASKPEPPPVANVNICTQQVAKDRLHRNEHQNASQQVQKAKEPMKKKFSAPAVDTPAKINSTKQQKLVSTKGKKVMAVKR